MASRAREWNSGDRRRKDDMKDGEDGDKNVERGGEGRGILVKTKESKWLVPFIVLIKATKNASADAVTLD